jgi:hypothetical protein
VEQLAQRRANLEGRETELRSHMTRLPRGSSEWERVPREGIAVHNELRKVLLELDHRR